MGARIATLPYCKCYCSHGPLISVIERTAQKKRRRRSNAEADGVSCGGEGRVGVPVSVFCSK